MSTSQNPPTKKSGVDMNIVFFGIVAIAFLFTVVLTIFPPHSKILEYKMVPTDPQSVQSKIEGHITADTNCADVPRIFVLHQEEVLAEGIVEGQDKGWNYTVPLSVQDTNTKELHLFAICDEANSSTPSTGSEKIKSGKVATYSSGKKTVEEWGTEQTHSVALVKQALIPDQVGQAALAAAKSSVTLAIGLIGYIALFLGLMKIVEKAGGLEWMANMIRPILVRLFPDIPANHPAMGAIIMNVAANALGLGNAATPFGLKAMKELQSINPHKDTATNAMCLFLAINTSGLALLPTGIIGLRAQFGSADPASIFPTTLFATGLSTISAILISKLLSRFFPSPAPDPDFVPMEHPQVSSTTFREFIPVTLFAMALGGLVSLVYVYGDVVSAWIMPVLIFSMLLVGFLRKVPVYETFIEGAKEGFHMGTMIIPYLIAILSAIAMLRASGGLEYMVGIIEPVTSLVALPGEVLPLALLRPLSGSGAFGLTAELVQTYGPDSYVGVLASTLNGSTETTFYVLAVYFGSVGVFRYRHALWAGLFADFMGIVGSLIAVNLFLNW